MFYIQIYLYIICVTIDFLTDFRTTQGNIDDDVTTDTYYVTEGNGDVTDTTAVEDHTNDDVTVTEGSGDVDDDITGSGQVDSATALQYI